MPGVNGIRGGGGTGAKDGVGLGVGDTEGVDAELGLTTSLCCGVAGNGGSGPRFTPQETMKAVLRHENSNASNINLMISKP
jgi:hypothetical protein